MRTRVDNLLQAMKLKCLKYIEVQMRMQSLHSPYLVHDQCKNYFHETVPSHLCVLMFLKRALVVEGGAASCKRVINKSIVCLIVANRIFF